MIHNRNADLITEISFIISKINRNGATAMTKQRKKYLLFILAVIAIEILYVVLVLSDIRLINRLAQYLFMTSWFLEIHVWFVTLPILILMNVLAYVYTVKNDNAAMVFTVLGGAIGGFFALKKNPSFRFNRATHYLYIAQFILLYAQQIINIIVF